MIKRRVGMYPRRPRLVPANSLAREEGQNFPALGVEALHTRAPGKALPFQVRQNRMHGWCPGPAGPTHGVPDAHSAADIPAIQPELLHNNILAAAVQLLEAQCSMLGVRAAALVD
jgi:hypothetical protein